MTKPVRVTATFEITFTPRDRDVLLLIARNLSYKEIGIELRISSQNVKNRAALMIQKTSSKNRYGLVLWALKQGIVKL